MSHTSRRGCEESGAPTLVHIAIPDGGTLSAEHHRAQSDAMTGPDGRPCVIMAHGVGATRDCGLTEFAHAFAAAGAEVIAFDYRHFAGSSGVPRQLVSLRGQLLDYRTAVAFARTLSGVDPARIVIWGVSLSGGHVVNVAAADSAIAGVISLTPAVDGLAAVVRMVEDNGLAHIGRLLRLGVADVVAALSNRGPVLAPVVGEPGTAAALCSPGAVDGMLATAGPSWRNAIAARLFLRIGTYRPIRSAPRVTCPVLMQIADHDQTAPAAVATRAASRMRATVHHYPCDHFDIYPGGSHHDVVVGDQVRFLHRLFVAQRASA